MKDYPFSKCYQALYWHTSVLPFIWYATLETYKQARNINVLSSELIIPHKVYLSLQLTFKKAQQI